MYGRFGRFGAVFRIERSSDPKQLDQSDLVEDRFARLVRQALERELISMGRAAEMLGLPLEDMRALARSWQEL